MAIEFDKESEIRRDSQSISTKSKAAISYLSSAFVNFIFIRLRRENDLGNNNAPDRSLRDNFAASSNTHRADKRFKIRPGTRLLTDKIINNPQDGRSK